VTLGLLRKPRIENAEVTLRFEGVPVDGVLNFVRRDRLETSQRFVTIAHELAHIFCGHLGSCPSRNARNGDESGWPDRQKFGKHEKEIEAEAAAFLIASRAGLIARSAAYLAAYVRHADMKQINMDLVVRAAARIERLADIHHGVMDFGSRPKQ
jgi:hypothetical protein